MATAVFTFARMNPPTVGHEKLVNEIKRRARAERGDALVFLTKTEDRKKNPVPFKAKEAFAIKAFGNIIVRRSNLRTIIDVMKNLEGRYDKVIMVVGSDRVRDFSSLLNRFNGKEYNFAELEVVSAGTRDPDEEGVSGMSASKMRKAAAANDFHGFKAGVPSGLRADKDAMQLFNAVRAGMGIVRDIKEAKVSTKDVARDLNTTPEVINVVLFRTGKGETAEQIAKRLKMKSAEIKAILKDLRSRKNVLFTNEEIELEEATARDIAVKVAKEINVDRRLVMLVLVGFNAGQSTAELSKILKPVRKDEIELIIKSLKANKFKPLVREEIDLDEKRTAASVLKKSRALKKAARKGKAKRARARKKVKTPAQLKVKAQKTARKILRDKLSKGNFDSLSFQAKDRIDDKIKKQKGKVERIAKKLLPKLKKKELERIAKVRAAKKESVGPSEILRMINELQQ